MVDQSTYVPSQQGVLSSSTPAQMRTHAESATLPSDWSPSQKSEYTARTNEATSRYVTDRYVDNIQTGTAFNLGDTLKSVPASASPGDIHARAATMENRVSGTDIPNEPRLTNAGMERVKTLETGAGALSDIQKSGTAITTDHIKPLGCAAEKQGLTGKDVANVAMFNGVTIPKDVLSSLGSIKGSMCEASPADNKSPAPTQSAAPAVEAAASR